MPAFMNRKVDVIEQRQLAPVQREIQKQQAVKDGPADKLDAGNGLPIDFRNTHFESIQTPSFAAGHVAVANVSYRFTGPSAVPAFRSMSRILAGAGARMTVRVISLPSCSMATVYVLAARLRKIYAPPAPVFTSSESSFNRTVTPASGTVCSVALS